MSQHKELDRREFTRQIMAGCGVLTLTVEPASSAEPPPPALPEDPRPEPWEETPPVELLILTALVRNYPSEHYTDEVLRGMYGDIAGDLHRGKLLRTVPLTNGDEPATVFRVMRNPSTQEESP